MNMGLIRTLFEYRLNDFCCGLVLEGHFEPEAQAWGLRRAPFFYCTANQPLQSSFLCSFSATEYLVKAPNILRLLPSFPFKCLLTDLDLFQRQLHY